MTATSPEPAKVRVTRLKVEKFRAIGSADIELGNTVALVGQNGAGKSSVLRALNAFFNFEAERQAFEAGWHRYSATTQSVIEITIDGLPTGTLPLVSGTGEFRGRLKYQRKPIWQVWKDGKWDTGDPPAWDWGNGTSPLVRVVGDEATAMGTLEGDFVTAATCP